PPAVWREGDRRHAARVSLQRLRPGTRSGIAAACIGITRGLLANAARSGCRAVGIERHLDDLLAIAADIDELRQYPLAVFGRHEFVLSGAELDLGEPLAGDDDVLAVNGHGNVRVADLDDERAVGRADAQHGRRPLDKARPAGRLADPQAKQAE